VKYGSLFAGIGGIDLGLDRAGMTCGWQVELDEYCRKVLAKHWPDVPRWDDVMTFPPEDWSEDKLQVDLIAGGFPCQDISVAGKGAGINGERSSLFHEIIRISGILRPRWILLENVSALLTRGLGAVLGELAKVGYDAEWHCIPASHVGAPQRRDRIFIICYLADTTSLGMEGDRSTGEQVPQLSLTEGLLGRYRAGAGTDQWGIEPNVDRVAHGIPRRMDRVKGLGNAVVPQVIEVIAKEIMKREVLR
jgi:DNA (cytosine-5)-methyltransferase 1